MRYTTYKAKEHMREHGLRHATERNRYHGYRCIRGSAIVDVNTDPRYGIHPSEAVAIASDARTKGLGVCLFSHNGMIRSLHIEGTNTGVHRF